MNAFQILPYALPFIALGTYGALRFARRLDRRSKAAQALQSAHAWHRAVVSNERSCGIHTHDRSITDITVNHGYVT